MFDEGSLKDDPEKAGQEMQKLLAAMATIDPEKELSQSSPLVEVHNSVWFRIAKVSHQFIFHQHIADNDLESLQGFAIPQKLVCVVRLADLLQALVRDLPVP